MNEIRPLPPGNWKCATFAPHECDGQLVGVLGACPVCEAGAAAEAAARDADRARIKALCDTPEFRRAAAAEHAWESRVS